MERTRFRVIEIRAGYHVLACKVEFTPNCETGKFAMVTSDRALVVHTTNLELLFSADESSTEETAGRFAIWQRFAARCRDLQLRIRPVQFELSPGNKRRILPC